MTGTFEIAPGLRLTAGGAAWLPAQRALVVADVHLGYAQAARRRGGWLPAVDRAADVASRLRDAVAEAGAARLVIAGDLRHSTRDVDAHERAEVARLLESLREVVTVDVVSGNHDLGMPGVHAVVRLGTVDVAHFPPATAPERWTVCGHLHPVVTLRDETGAGVRVPCALAGPRVLILPAFGAWQGGTSASRLVRTLPAGPWRTLATAGGRVWEIA